MVPALLINIYLLITFSALIIILILFIIFIIFYALFIIKVGILLIN